MSTGINIFRLPPEIREIIWQFAAIQDEPFEFVRYVPGKTPQQLWLPIQNDSARHRLALTSVCHETRKACLPVLHANNTFVLHRVQPIATPHSLEQFRQLLGEPYAMEAQDVVIVLNSVDFRDGFHEDIKLGDYLETALVEMKFSQHKQPEWRIRVRCQDMDNRQELSSDRELPGSSAEEALTLEFDMKDWEGSWSAVFAKLHDLRSVRSDIEYIEQQLRECRLESDQSFERKLKLDRLYGMYRSKY